MNASVRQREAALRLALKKARADLDFAIHVLDALKRWAPGRWALKATLWRLERQTRRELAKLDAVKP